MGDVLLEIYLADLKSIRSIVIMYEFRKVLNWWHGFVTVKSEIDSSDNRVDFSIAGEILSETTTK